MDPTELYLSVIASAATPRVQKLPGRPWKRRPSVPECVGLMKGMVEHAQRVRAAAKELDRSAGGTSDAASLKSTYRTALSVTFMPHLFSLTRTLGRRRATKVQCTWLAVALRAYADTLVRHAELLRRAAKVRLEEQEDALAVRNARRLEHR